MKSVFVMAIGVLLVAVALLSTPNSTPQVDRERGSDAAPVQLALAARSDASPTRRIERLALRGVVVSASDGAISGAIVTALPRTRSEGLNGRIADSSLPPLASTASDATGQFSLAIRSERSCLVVARADGFAPTVVAVDDLSQVVRVVLNPALILTVRVLNQAGAPVVGASVSLISLSVRPGLADSLVSDRDGVARFESLRSGDPFRLEGRHDQHGSAHMSVRIEASRTVELSLARGARTLRGQVVDSVTRRPIQNAKLGQGTLGTADLPVGPNGQFEIANWVIKRLTGSVLSVRASGYVARRVTVRGFESLIVAMQPSVAVVGQVVNESRSPVEGAAVDLWQSPSRETSGLRIHLGSAISDANGVFRVAGAAPRALHSLVISAHDHGTFVRELETTTGECDVGEVLVSLGTNVSGVIVSAEGRPVAGAKLVLSGRNENNKTLGIPRGHRPVQIVHSGWSNMEGQFRFNGIAGGTYRLMWLRDAAPRGEREVVVQHDPVDLRIELSAMRLLRIHLRDSKGAPLQDVSFEVKSDLVRRPTALVADGSGSASVEIPISSSEIEITVVPGQFRGRSFLPLVAKRFLVGAQDVIVTLGTGQWVAGQVVDLNARPLADLVVAFYSGEGLELARTDTWHDGRFGLVLSRAATRASVVGVGRVFRGGHEHRFPNGYTGSAEAGDEGQFHIVAARPKGERTQIRVLAPSGEPAPGAVLVLPFRGIEGVGMANYEADTSGIVTIPWIAMDTELAVWARPQPLDRARRGWLRSRSQLVDRDTPRPFEVTLRSGTRVDGHVVDSTGSPVAGAAVLLRPKTSAGVERAKTDSRGGFSLLADPDIIEQGHAALLVVVPGSPGPPVRLALLPGSGFRDLRVTVSR